MFTDFLVIDSRRKVKERHGICGDSGSQIEQSFYKLHGLTADELNLLKEPTT